MASTTLLTLSGPGIPDYSARGLHQTLRRVDGGFPKYRSTITGSDVDPPAFDRFQKAIPRRTVNGTLINVGFSTATVLSVGCIQELGYLTSGGSPEKSVVSSSSRVQDSWTFYCPLLSMMVIDFSVEYDEYGSMTHWSLDIEET